MTKIPENYIGSTEIGDTHQSCKVDWEDDYSYDPQESEPIYLNDPVESFKASIEVNESDPNR